MNAALQGVDDVQTATADFFIPVAAAYGAALIGWWWIASRWPQVWPAEADAETRRPWLDLGVCVAVMLAILGMGQLYRVDWLLPKRGLWNYTINQALIYAPLFAALLARRQSGSTVWLTRHNLGRKVGIGLALGFLAVVVFLALRGDLGQLPDEVARAVTPNSLAHFFPVFMEGVAVAFIFIRLRWAVGALWATVGPALLFAAAHVPRGIESGSTFAEIAAFFVFNTLIVIVILQVLRRSRDVIWLGLVHFLMDVPTRAF